MVSSVLRGLLFSLSLSTLIFLYAPGESCFLGQPGLRWPPLSVWLRLRTASGVFTPHRGNMRSALRFLSDRNPWPAFGWGEDIFCLDLLPWDSGAPALLLLPGKAPLALRFLFPGRSQRRAFCFIGCCLVLRGLRLGFHLGNACSLLSSQSFCVLVLFHFFAAFRWNFNGYSKKYNDCTFGGTISFFLPVLVEIPMLPGKSTMIVLFGIWSGVWPCFIFLLGRIHGRPELTNFSREYTYIHTTRSPLFRDHFIGGGQITPFFIPQRPNAALRYMLRTNIKDT